MAHGKVFPNFRELMAMIITFGLTVLAWIFFRALSVWHALYYIKRIFIFSLPKGSDFVGTRLHPYVLLILVTSFVIIEWLGRENQFAIQNIGLKWKPPFRYAFYYAIILSFIFLGGKTQEFIYFQF